MFSLVAAAAVGSLQMSPHGCKGNTSYCGVWADSLGFPDVNEMTVYCDLNAPVGTGKCQERSECPAGEFGDAGAVGYADDWVCSDCPPRTYIRDQTKRTECLQMTPAPSNSAFAPGMFGPGAIQQAASDVFGFSTAVLPIKNHWRTTADTMYVAGRCPDGWHVPLFQHCYDYLDRRGQDFTQNAAQNAGKCVEEPMASRCVPIGNPKPNYCETYGDIRMRPTEIESGVLAPQNRILKNLDGTCYLRGTVCGGPSGDPDDDTTTIPYIDNDLEIQCGLAGTAFSKYETASGWIGHPNSTDLNPGEEWDFTPSLKPTDRYFCSLTDCGGPGYNTYGCSGSRCGTECDSEYCARNCYGADCGRGCTGYECAAQCTGPDCGVACMGTRCAKRCFSSNSIFRCGAGCHGNDCGGSSGATDSATTDVGEFVTKRNMLVAEYNWRVSDANARVAAMCKESAVPDCAAITGVAATEPAPPTATEPATEPATESATGESTSGGGGLSAGETAGVVAGGLVILGGVTAGVALKNGWKPPGFKDVLIGAPLL